jgi:uncharacterized membrane protein
VFDIVYRSLAKIGYTHPIHPTEVHMPIGLVVGALVFAVTAAVFRRQRLAMTPRHCIILAFIWVFPTMLFGFMDWQHFYAGAWMLPIKVKLVAAPCLAFLLLVSILLGRQYGATSLRVLPFYGLCFCLVVLLGYFGGQLVYGQKLSAPAPQHEAGEKLFAAHCASCHPGGGNVLDPSKPVTGSARLKDLDTFVGWLRHPMPPMPAFSASTLSDESCKELLGYIRNVLEHAKGP